MADFFVSMSPKCHKIAEHGRDFTAAYSFVKLLSSFVRHPILIDFKSNKDAYRLKTRMGVLRFNGLLKLAISNRLAYYEGNNLRLISHTFERKLFGVRSTADYDTIRPEHIKQYIQIQILKNLFNRQKRKITTKLRSAAIKGVAQVTEAETVITLSCRKAAEILHLRSYSHASNLLTDLSKFGLVLIPNRTQIPAEQYVTNKGKYNHRFDKKTGQYFILGANIPHFTSFYSKPLTRNVKSCFADRMLGI